MTATKETVKKTLELLGEYKEEYQEQMAIRGTII